MTGRSATLSAVRARRRLLWLLALFALPVLVAYVLYYAGWRPEASGNYGTLVQPARPLPGELALTALDGTSQRLDTLRGRWSLVAFVDGACRPSCARQLDTMQRLILAHGKEAHRVRAVLVVSDARPLESLRQTLRDYPGALVLAGPPAAVGELAGEFRSGAGMPPTGLDGLYLVDPLGNFMMYWSANADIRRMRKDLSRLLRVSQVG